MTTPICTGINPVLLYMLITGHGLTASIPVLSALIFVLIILWFMTYYLFKELGGFRVKLTISLIYCIPIMMMIVELLKMIFFK